MPEHYPLDWLSSDEASVVALVIEVLERTIRDQDLKAKLIGGLLCEIDEWGAMNRPRAH